MDDTIQQRIQEIKTQQAALQEELAGLYRQSGQENRPPLEGVRILDLSWAVFGPLSTQILSDMGAEVIKVEKVDGGDMGRQTYSAYFTNRNKQYCGQNLGRLFGNNTIVAKGFVLRAGFFQTQPVS